MVIEVGASRRVLEYSFVRNPWSGLHTRSSYLPAPRTLLPAPKVTRWQICRWRFVAYNNCHIKCLKRFDT